MTIGQRIKDRRIQLGLTVDELATILKKNRATVYRYESNEIEKLPISILEPLSKALHTTPAYLMGWEDAEIKSNEEIDSAEMVMWDDNGNAYDVNKLPEEIQGDISEYMNRIQYEYSEKDFGLQVVIDNKSTLNLDALPINKKKDILRFIRFMINEEIGP